MADDHEWFTKTIVADGPHMAVWVNGYQVTDWTDTRPPKENAREGLRLGPGAIAIQGHDPTTDFLFRNLQIVELPQVKCGILRRWSGQCRDAMLRLRRLALRTTMGGLCLFVAAPTTDHSTGSRLSDPRPLTPAYVFLRSRLFWRSRYFGHSRLAAGRGLRRCIACTSTSASRARIARRF